ncbi:MAG: nitroreductase family protein [Armatimonadota bacterium]
MTEYAEPVLAAIRTRRVVRFWAAEPLAQRELRRVVEAARWAPTAGNRRVHHIVAVRDPVTIRLIKTISPGISGTPTGMIVIAIDHEQVARAGGQVHHRSLMIDVGTAAQTMLLAAHALGLGAGPVTSFSRAGLRVLVGLPASMSPEMIVCLGHPAPNVVNQRVQPSRRIRLRDLVTWERFNTQESAPDEGGTP